ncbi:hypothetical protein [Hippea sp. KM1]|uniref:hypothetical protein n=1 Tax=Hippea sp. KM1 TaxID=944481 RepID=UPI00046C9D5E|nr:hypothetical protein [Hippea sp. KM1]
MEFKNNTIHLNIPEGEVLIDENVYLDLSSYPLDAYIKDKSILKVSLKNLLNATVVKKQKGFDFNLDTKNLNSIVSILKESYEIGSLNDLKIDNDSMLSIKGFFENKDRLFMQIDTQIGKLTYKGITVKNLSATLPIIIGVDLSKTGQLNATSDIYKKTIKISSSILAKNSRICLKADIESKNPVVKNPIEICANLKNKTLITKGINLKLKTSIGYLKTHITRIALKNSTATVKGYINIEAFDGRIAIKNISLSLKEMPILRMDVDFSHINLEKLTNLTNFGRITGFIEGYAHNIALVNFKNPLSFDVLVKTQSVKGQTKKISLKAVNSISKVGGGYVSIAIPFFKSFSYSDIGFRASLKNNIFTIHGLYKDGNVEYIIRRGFLGGINVVNMNTNNNISWDDFLSRLKRVLEKREVKR